MAQKRKKSVRTGKRRRRVTPSREPAVIGLVCLAIWTVVLILCILDRAGQGIRRVIIVLMALCVPLLMTRNIRIEYDKKTGFVYRNILGISRKYRWQDVTAVREVRAFGRRGSQCDTLIIMRKKHIRVHWNSHHAAGFLMLAREYANRKENEYAADRRESLPEG